VRAIATATIASRSHWLGAPPPPPPELPLELEDELLDEELDEDEELLLEEEDELLEVDSVPLRMVLPSSSAT